MKVAGLRSVFHYQHSNQKCPLKPLRLLCFIVLRSEIKERILQEATKTYSKLVFPCHNLEKMKHKSLSELPLVY